MPGMQQEATKRIDAGLRAAVAGWGRHEDAEDGADEAPTSGRRLDLVEQHA
jgi:hypothetical protein